MNPDGTNGWFGFSDDFESWNAVATTVAFGHGPYYPYLDTGSTIANLTTEVGGVLQLAAHSDAHDEASFIHGAVHGLVKVAVGTAGTVTARGGKVLFEARVRFPLVTNVGSVFVGLQAPNTPDGDTFFADEVAVAGKDMIGFWSLATDGDALSFGYNVSSGTAVEVGTTVIAAATWYKVGFVYDPKAAKANRLLWFVDGAEQASRVTGDTIGEDAANNGAATFPGGVQMSPAIAAKADAAGPKLFDIDWWSVAMESIE
jgi:hypothetical protein